MRPTLLLAMTILTSAFFLAACDKQETSTAVSTASSDSSALIESKWTEFFKETTANGLQNIADVHSQISSFIEVDLSHIDQDDRELIRVYNKVNSQIDKAYEINAVIFKAKEDSEKLLTACENNYLIGINDDGSTAAQNSSKICKANQDQFEDKIFLLKARINNERQALKEVYSSLIDTRQLLDPKIIQYNLKKYPVYQEVEKQELDNKFTKRMLEINKLLNNMPNFTNKNLTADDLDNISMQLNVLNKIIDELHEYQTSAIGPKNKRLIDLAMENLMTRKTRLYLLVDGK